MGRTTGLAVCVVGALLVGCGAAPPNDGGPTGGGSSTTDGGAGPEQLRVEVVQVMPHDRTAFTQGLELVDGLLYEGTGLEGRSTLRVVDPATGTVQRQTALPQDLFGEGITVVGPTIWQLTWQEGIAIQRDRGTLEELRRVSYTGEGWGLCHDGTAGRLVMSDGTDRLTFRDPESFEQVGEVRVSSGGSAVDRINELECVDGAVYANIWQTDTIMRIDPGSGQVTASIDVTGLLTPEERAGTDVLNGIAAIPGTDEFLLTGKYWPKMFRVKFVS